jgi:hypothetical protein
MLRRAVTAASAKHGICVARERRGGVDALQNGSRVCRGGGHAGGETVSPFHVGSLVGPKPGINTTAPAKPETKRVCSPPTEQRDSGLRARCGSRLKLVWSERSRARGRGAERSNCPLVPMQMERRS